MSRIKRIFASTSLTLIISIMLGIFAIASVGGGSTAVVTYTGQTVDTITFNGVKVEAKYSLGGGYGNSEYSCAALVMKFYKAVYGFDVWNLSSPYATPTCSNGEHFSKTDTPRVGDIVRFQDRTHWALVKSVKGGTVTLIEQNWGYRSASGYVAAIERTVTVGDPQVSFFTYSAYDTTNGEKKAVKNAAGVDYDSWEGALRASNINGCEQVSVESKDNLLVVTAQEQFENALANSILN